MQLSSFLFRLVRFLLPVCIVITTWLHLYPIFHRCAFPTPPSTRPICTSQTQPCKSSTTLPTIAPFRLLALGDPQLEGDSSLPRPGDPVFPSLEPLHSILDATQPLADKWATLLTAISSLFAHDIPRQLNGFRKRIDLWGNDYYLAHIYRRLHWWTDPTHVTVLGDLLGSQWISDEEFERRGWRFWNRVFEGAERVPDEIMDAQEGEPWTEPLGEDKAWKRRVINIAGNHDVGYAGDLSEHRVERFERLFGRVNWEVEFTLPNYTYPATIEEDNTDSDATENGSGQDQPNPPPSLRLIILNSMNLDTSALSPSLQTATYTFLNTAITSSRPVDDHTTATILLTHIPLHKAAGVCVDPPFFDFYPGGGVKEQNHLSAHASKGILEGVFGLSKYENAPGRGLGRRGVVVTGHDHEGCDVVHFIPRSSSASSLAEEAPSSSSSDSESKLNDSNEEEPQWQAMLTSTDDLCLATLNSTPHIREITLRSMMGEFGGYAGFLSAWFDEGLGELGEWRLEFQSCSIGIQHWWWAVHILDLVTFGMVAFAVVLRVWEVAQMWTWMLRRRVVIENEKVTVNAKVK
ncbi:hypothetical protein K432DRAFT_379037 [Lepidopterella palustris CBS 459.81]|uniref:Calcineurin-like phosphoesterase domain-containing protein n=1 Tax=Lepidopterella palustris CBS 459.81 TaxID=1314670 RepID=A0A8E2JIS5_9PEZI|nr:hypothetical protein K432DRAFT_379037 [Lepidopterella palustris CBS 459.81]